MFMISSYIRAKEVGGRYIGEPGSANTLRAYESALTQVEHMLGKPLYKLKTQDADTLMEIMQNEDFSNAYKGLILSALRGAFTWAIGVGKYSHAHPFDGIRNPPKRRELPIILTKDQVDQFFDHLKTNPKYQLFFKLMYYGGLRIGEVISLQKEDVGAGGVLVRGKGNKQRLADLPESVMVELRAHVLHYTKTRYVFYGQSKKTKRNQPLTKTYPYVIFHATKRAVGLPDKLHPHNLRHTSATHFYAATNDIALTQKHLGHARVETTLLYAQVSNDQLTTARKSVFGD